jgi:hypothetical protein
MGQFPRGLAHYRAPHTGRHVMCATSDRLGTMPASSQSESGFAMAFMIDLAFTSAAILDE